jgi:hypothetical protein
MGAYLDVRGFDIVILRGGAIDVSIPGVTAYTLAGRLYAGCNPQNAIPVEECNVTQTTSCSLHVSSARFVEITFSYSDSAPRAGMHFTVTLVAT